MMLPAPDIHGSPRKLGLRRQSAERAAIRTLLTGQRKRLAKLINRLP